MDGKTINKLSIKKCHNNITTKTQSLITNSTLPPPEPDSAMIKCENSIMPFYKVLDWFNPIDGSIFPLIRIDLERTIRNLEKTRSGNLKYLKYKNKYLQLKKNLTKK